jgi:hypothetical protein
MASAIAAIRRSMKPGDVLEVEISGIGTLAAAWWMSFPQFTRIHPVEAV